MTNIEFDNEIKEIKNLHPLWFELADVNKATKEDIANVEKELLCQLPDEYKYFLKNYGGGYFAFTIIYSLCKDSKYNLIKINTHNHKIAKDYILFSENQVGDFYGFKKENNMCTSVIYFFDHETNVWSKTNYKTLFDYIILSMNNLERQ